MKQPDVVRLLELDQLFVDPEVQRNVEPRKVQRISDNLNEAALGTLTVSRRDNGRYHVVDGQHRVAALTQINDGSYKVLCRVFTGLTVNEEATLFRLLNNTSRPHAVDSFRIRVIEGEQGAAYITRVLTDNGWRLATGSADITIDTSSDTYFYLLSVCYSDTVFIEFCPLSWCTYSYCTQITCYQRQFPGLIL